MTFTRIFIAISSFILILSKSAESQNQNLKGQMIYKDNKTAEGYFDLSDLGEKGVLYFTNSGNENITVTPDEVVEVNLSNNLILKTKRIKYRNDLNEPKTQYFFVVVLVDGYSDLLEVYGGSFDYALSTVNGNEALQIIDHNEREIEYYKAVFYSGFRECDHNINTSELKFTRSSFISAVNQYNKCINPTYNSQAMEKVQYLRMELNLITGYKYSDLRFEAQPTNVQEQEAGLVYKFKFRRSINRFYGLRIGANVYRDKIYIGTGFELIEYTFNEYTTNSDTDSEKRMREINFSEVLFKTFIDFRHTKNRIKGSISIGADLHSIQKDLDRGFRLRAESFSNSSASVVPIIKGNEELKSSYITLNIAPSIFYEVYKYMDIGVSYSINSGTENFISESRDNATDYLRMQSLSIHLKLKFDKPK